MANPYARIDPELGELLGPLAGLTKPPAAFKVPKSDDTSVPIDTLVNNNLRGLLNAEELTPDQVALLDLLLSYKKGG